MLKRPTWIFPARSGQLVEREDAAVRARQHPVMNRELVREHVPAARCADWVDVADHIGDRDVGRGELFDVARFAIEPRDRRVVAHFVDLHARELRDRRERIIVDLAPRDHGNRVVEQRRERAEDARLRLTAKTEQDKVVPREQGVHDLRNDGLVVADNAGEDGAALRESGEQIGAQLVLHGAMCERGGSVRRTLQRAEGFRVRRRHGQLQCFRVKMGRVSAYSAAAVVR